MVTEQTNTTSKMNWLLEIARFIYAFVVIVVLFLFFTLLLDVFCLLAFGGWNPLLGKWPIFSGTVNSAFYSPPAHVLSLLIGLGVIARIIQGERIPYLLETIFRTERAEVKGDDT